jgi:cephalosporin hydroxylase
MLKTLAQLYAEHEGKVSDKWSIYLSEYERVFDAYRDKPIRILEIGVQNGGSLEIWSKYFSHAQKVIGCDINTACALLNYSDPRIALVIGDVNSETIQESILCHSSVFDIIIDDGSHRSSDILKSFIWGFSHLTDGGIFIVEDLHCSYWKDFEGGLFDPFSSMTFFQYLTDIINYEHWGIERTRKDILSTFFANYGFDIEEEFFCSIHSIEFINSMCVIRKAKPESNRLGVRVTAGSVEMIQSGALSLNGFPSNSASIATSTHANNMWADRKTSPELSEYERKIKDLNFVIAKNREQSVHLQQTLVEREGKVNLLGQTIVEREQKIAELQKAILSYQNSLSWLVTKPFRFIWSQIRSFIAHLKVFFE